MAIAIHTVNLSITMYTYLRKKAWTAFLLFLYSCAAATQAKWEYDEVISHYPAVSSATLYFEPCNLFREMRLEICRTCSGLKTYLSIFSLSLPQEASNPHKTSITLACDGLELTFLADRLEGGQRLLLPKEAEEALIRWMLEDHIVTITCGRFQTEVPPKDFLKLHALFKR